MVEGLNPSVCWFLKKKSLSSVILLITAAIYSDGKICSECLDGWILPVVDSIVLFNVVHCTQLDQRVVDPGEGPRGPGSPPIFRPNWGPKGRKKFFWRPPPPYQRFWMTAPPLSQGLDAALPAFFICTKSCYLYLTYCNQ